MASTNNSAGVPALPNPLTPMAFLPPDLAFQVTISMYILVGSAAVLIWDVLHNLYGDYLLLFQYRIGVPTVAYFISRLSSLAYVLSSTIFETAPAGNCANFQKGLDWLYPIAIPATSLLFLYRIRAVFDGNRLVIAFFAFMWLAVLAGCLTVTQGVVGAHIGTTEYCFNASLEPYVAAAAIVPLVNDTLIFLAITWRLMQNSHIRHSFKDGFKLLVFGDYLPAFSKAIMQDGQAYYLTTVSTNLLTVIMLYIGSLPVTYRTMFTVPNIVLMNIMAGRVYRKTKFGLFNDSSFVSTTSRDEQSRAGGMAGVSIPLPPLGRTTRPKSVTFGRPSVGGNMGMGMQGIAITTIVEKHDDDDYLATAKSYGSDKGSD